MVSVVSISSTDIRSASDGPLPGAGFSDVIAKNDEEQRFEMLVDFVKDEEERDLYIMFEIFALLPMIT